MRKGRIVAGFLLWTMMIMGACAPKRPVAPPAELPPQPPRPQYPPTQLAWQPLNLERVEREIQRRQANLEVAKSKRGEITGANRAVLDAWITAVEDQVNLLTGILSEAKELQRIRDPQEASSRSSRLAGLLLECLSLAPLDPPVPPPPRIVEETRISWEPLRSAYYKGDCNWFLQEYEALVKLNPRLASPQDVEVMRGICLGKLGRRKEAIGILEPIASQGRMIDAQQVQYMTANWLFEEGQLDKAEVRYREVLESNGERQKWADLAKVRLEQIRLRKGEAPPRPEVEERREEAPLGEQKRPQDVAPPQPQEPEPPPVTFPPREPVAPAQVKPLPPEPVRPQLPTAPEKAEIPAQPQPSQPGQGQEVQLARLQQAQKLLEEERYEEAIVAFGQVEGQEYREQASKGIQEAQDRYAEKRRKEAAALVLKAREETGQARKASLLKALEILEETNRRYPNNRYASKIQQNINDVIGQIRAIDPGFRR